MLEWSLQVVALLHLANPSLSLSHPKPPAPVARRRPGLGSVAVPAGGGNCCTLSNPCLVPPLLSSLQLLKEVAVMSKVSRHQCVMYKADLHHCVVYKGYLHQLYRPPLPVPYPRPASSLHDSQDVMSNC